MMAAGSRCATADWSIRTCGGRTPAGPVPYSPARLSRTIRGTAAREDGSVREY
jgi:hypothetical protein